MSYQSKDSELAARELAAQRIVAVANLVAGSSDLPNNIAINNSTLTATVITLSVNEPVKSCTAVRVSNRATGAVVALAAAPSLAVAQKISVTVDGTALTSVALEFIYEVA